MGVIRQEALSAYFNKGNGTKTTINSGPPRVPGPSDALTLAELTYGNIPQINKLPASATPVAPPTSRNAFESVPTRPKEVSSAVLHSLISPDEDEDDGMPSKAELQGYARRYIKLGMVKPSPGKTLEQEVSKIVDFYGASKDRAARFISLVQALEAD